MVDLILRNQAPVIGGSQVGQVLVAAGQAVKKGDTVLVLEAMKMENNINAGKSGVVKAICVNKGDSVLEGNDIIIIE